MFGYEFVDLSPAQVELRRKQLDQAGLQGYLLPIGILSVVYAARLLLNPKSSSQGSSNHHRVNGLQRYYRRVTWLLGDTYFTEFGPLQVQAFGLIYAVVLITIAIKGTGNDYMHVTKALSHVAVSQLPIHYLLSFKHPQSPVTLATGLTHERLNAYHRLLGRLIHTMLITHAILYVNFFLAIGVLRKRFQDWDVIYGSMSLFTMDIIGLLTIPYIRKVAYHRLFYRSHIILSLLLVVLAWLHVPYTRNYVAQAGFFWISNGILRRGKMTESATIKASKIGNTLVELTASLKDGSSWEAWVPGMHGYLNQAGLGPRTPLTVTDVRDNNGHVEVHFVVRDMGGPMTSLLGRVAPKDKQLTLDVEGPYGEAKEYMADVLARVNEPALIVAGGVGATYALPIYLAMAEQRKSTTNLRLVWIVKQAEDARWGLELLRGKSNRNVEIYMTRENEDEKVAAAFRLPGVEVNKSRARPNFKNVLSTFIGAPETKSEPFSVMVCGPPALSRELRKATSTYVWHGRKVRWYEEQFGFGGS